MYVSCIYYIILYLYIYMCVCVTTCPKTMMEPTDKISKARKLLQERGHNIKQSGDVAKIQ